MSRRCSLLLLAAALALAACGGVAPEPIYLPTENGALLTLEAENRQTNIPMDPTATQTPPGDSTPQPESTATLPAPTLQAIDYRPQMIFNPNGVYGLDGFPENYNPLTGLPVEDPQILNRRPVLIKVSNYPPSGRPHAGLSYSDMVFEYYIGEGSNRFLALYYGQDCLKVGPIRSGRLVDPQLTNMYGGLLGYGNADARVDVVIVDDLGDRAISFNKAPCPPMCGQETHSVVGVFGNSAEFTKFAVRQGIDNTRPDLRGMVFESKPPEFGLPGTFLAVEYAFFDRGEWRYDTASGKYLRWIEDGLTREEVKMIPLVDRLTGNQLAFSNIIVIEAGYIEFNPTLHQILVWDNVQGQKALVFRDGLVNEAVWKAEGHNQPMRFYNTNGKPFALKPGNTWIVIAGHRSTYEQPRTGEWEIRFQLP